MTKEEFEQLQELKDSLDTVIYEARNILKSLPQHMRDRARHYWLGNLMAASGEALSECSLKKFIKEAEAHVEDDEEDGDDGYLITEGDPRNHPEVIATADDQTLQATLHQIAEQVVADEGLPKSAEMRAAALD